MELNNFSLMTGLAIGINIPLVTIIIVTLISRYRNKQQIKKNEKNLLLIINLVSGLKKNLQKQEVIYLLNNKH
ncbi:hypothetical protein [Cyanothece sp. BG0011]|uniref:hypothetical protein n=1 Tax=Cyanothece sp. BG0011 TaxID=2082950 RepID=UPI0018E50975|nr:hypothetical protein [Cyanothece sp. BG0011]